jgi:hypothetical protein
MVKSSHIVTTFVTSDASPTRSRHRRASNVPETIGKAASNSSTMSHAAAITCIASPMK